MHEAESSKKRKEKTAQAKKAVRKQRGEPFGKCNWRFQASGALDAFVGFASFARTEARWKVQEADVCCVSLGVAVQGNAKGKEQQPFSPKKRTKVGQLPLFCGVLWGGFKGSRKNGTSRGQTQAAPAVAPVVVAAAFPDPAAPFSPGASRLSNKEGGETKKEGWV
eukprot:95504-Pelagomonas_calceolata.AAC.4